MIKNILYSLLFIFLFAFTIRIYFSEKNIIYTNKSRTLFSSTQNINLKDVPLLLNDTKNIIEYSNDVNIYIEKQKKYIFEDLIEQSR
tara:strand:- start:203 stop:463 length:261 start_codon:yes stop_codon:yes gene_type:complete